MTSALFPIELVLPPVPHGADSVAPAADAAPALQHYVVALALDLGLPIAPRVSVREATEIDRFMAGERFKLTLGGRPARIALEADPLDSAPDGFGPVARAVFENRALLLRDADLPLFRQRLQGRWRDVADAELLQGLKTMAELCVDLGRLTKVAEEAGFAQAQALAHEAALGLGVEFHPRVLGIEQHLAENVREIAGVLLPPFATAVADLPEFSFRLRLNDAWLPAVEAPAGPWIGSVLRRHLPLLITGSLVEFLLASLSRHQERLVRCVRQRFEPATLVAVLRSIVAEGLSVANLRGVLEALLLAHGRTGVSDADLLVLAPHTGGMLADGRTDLVSPLTPVELAEIVRAADPLALWVGLVSAAADTVAVILGSDAFEADLLSASAGLPEGRESLLRRVAAPLGSAGHADGSPQIIVVSSAARLPLHRLIELEFPSVRVVSWSELPDSAVLAPEAHIQ